MTFTAIVLICSLSTPINACDEVTAIGTVSRTVASELACSHGWQETIAKDPRGDLEGVYAKTLCRRNSQASRQP